MFKKIQHKTNTDREVNAQRRAKVFSYYNNRPAVADESSREARGSSTNSPKKSTSSNGFKSIVYVIFGFVMLGIIAYSTTLSSEPRIVQASSSAADLDVDSTLPSGKKLASYEQQINTIFNNSWTNKNKLLIDAGAVALEIEEKYPELGDVAVVLPFVGRKPVIKVIPAKPAIVLGNGDGAYVLSAAGRVLSEAADYDKKTIRPLPVVIDQSGLELKSGDPGLRGEAVVFILDIINYLEADKLTVENIILPFDSPYDIHVNLAAKQYFAKFNMTGDSDIQSGSLLAINKKLNETNIMPTEYIDVRVTGKVFYK